MSPWKSQSGPETLDNLRPGCQAAVLEVRERGRQEVRLQEMGIVPGVPVEVLSSGSTLLVRVGELRLSLREEAAKFVTVLPAY